MTENYTDYRGITHCRPHGNKMPCATCGERLLKVTGDTCDLCGDTIDGGICDCEIDTEIEE